MKLMTCARACVVVTCVLMTMACQEDAGTVDPVDMSARADMSVTDMGESPDSSSSMDQGVAPSDMNDMSALDLGGAPDLAAEDMTQQPDQEVDMPAADMAQGYPPVTTDPLGGARPAAVKVPQGYDNTRSVPLVIVLHGYTSNGTQVGGYFGLVQPLVDQKDFILVVPEGTRDSQRNQFWNATNACCDGFRTGVDDLGYLKGLIKEAGERFNVDTGKVYLLGHSNGGFMSYRMACDASDVVTGIFSLAGATYENVADCKPERPVHIIQMHGTADATILYAGGGSLYFGAAAYPGAVETVSSWAGYNGCDAGIMSRPVGAVASASTLPVGVDGFDGCDDGGSVQLWTIENGSHVPFLPAPFGGVVLDRLFSFDRTP